MELPHIGQHCNKATCNRLDFLPFTCDSCTKVFCSTHFSYASHACPTAQRKDVQVPVCPLCGEAVPTAPGVEPDVTVGQHIDQQCKSETKKVYTYQCARKGCKGKEMVPVTCKECKSNFCLRHRHTNDHDCKGPAGPTAALAANAAEYRRSNKPTSLPLNNPRPRAAASSRSVAPQRNTAAQQVQLVQGNMTEDEALARALALSIMELDESADRNRRNETAAAAQRNTTVPVGGRDGTNSTKEKCSLS